MSIIKWVTYLQSISDRAAYEPIRNVLIPNASLETVTNASIMHQWKDKSKWNDPKVIASIALSFAASRAYDPILYSLGSIIPLALGSRRPRSLGVILPLMHAQAISLKKHQNSIYSAEFYWNTTTEMVIPFGLLIEGAILNSHTMEIEGVLWYSMVIAPYMINVCSRGIYEARMICE